jgi:hypothetical protein
MEELIKVIKVAIQEVIDLDDAMTKLKLSTDVGVIDDSNDKPLASLEEEIHHTRNRINILNSHLSNLERKRDYEWFVKESNEIGEELAIYKWCKLNNKYFSEELLKAAIKENNHINTYKSFPTGLFMCYKKNLTLRQYKDLTFSDSKL